MLTTMDPLPVFPLTDLGEFGVDAAGRDEGGARTSDVSTPRAATPVAATPVTMAPVTMAPVPMRGPSPSTSRTGARYGRSGMAAEVIGALDEVAESDAEDDSREYVVSDDMHIEANDLSLVSKRGRLLASFRKGKSS